jgi:hypothetical protein
VLADPDAAWWLMLPRSRFTESEPLFAWTRVGRGKCGHPFAPWVFVAVSGDVMAALGAPAGGLEAASTLGRRLSGSRSVTRQVDGPWCQLAGYLFGGGSERLEHDQPDRRLERHGQPVGQRRGVLAAGPCGDVQLVVVWIANVHRWRNRRDFFAVDARWRNGTCPR